MQVGRAHRAVPGPRRHPHGEDDAGDPLEHHQQREQAIRLLVDLGLRLREELVGAAGDRVGELQGGHQSAVEKSGQPKTLVAFRSVCPPLMREMSESSPAFSPTWPREPVMPPLKISRPFAS